MSKPTVSKPFTVFEFLQHLSRAISNNPEFANLHILGMELDMYFEGNNPQDDIPPKLLATIMQFNDGLDANLLMAQAYANEQATKARGNTHPAPEKLQ